MVVSAIVNAYVSTRLYKVARNTRSVALEADALHHKTDIYTSAGVALGLVLILLTGVKWLDPAVAILVALFIIKESYNLLREAFTPLLDTAWDESEITDLKARLDKMGVRYHDLRTRAAGNYRFIDIHIEVPKEETVGDAHKYCDQIESELMSVFENLNVTIHVEPS
jgi:cation diffusion facilitator family transporter